MKVNFLLSLLVLSAAILTGCGKDDDTTNGPAATSGTGATGVVRGTVLPYYGVKEIYLASGTDTIKTMPNPLVSNQEMGNFEFDKVKPGNYTVGVYSTINFTSPLPVSINVAPGQAIDLKRFELYSASNGIMTLTYNDTVYSGSPTIGGNQVSLATQRYYFFITLPTITGPGVYTPATHRNLRIRVLDKAYRNWHADDTIGTATVTVSSMHPVSKFGNATFSFTAVRPGKPDKVITNGSLYSVKLNQ